MRSFGANFFPLKKLGLKKYVAFIARKKSKLLLSLFYMKKKQEHIDIYCVLQMGPELLFLMSGIC